MKKNLCSFFQSFECGEILQMLNAVAENKTILSFWSNFSSYVAGGKLLFLGKLNFD